MDAFEAIADPVRRDLLVRLGSGPARVVDLAAEHPISRPAVSRHLRVLTEAGLVAGATHGRERRYRLERAGLAAVRSWLDAVEAPAPPVPERALDGLDLEVRRTSRDRRGASRPGSRGAEGEEEAG
ncbi:ArsR/SmtB family transcription factor [Nocardioides guangzhouensis]|uniref:ArsR/SmtB family transcription factor n=1 Tax=Nocardioides guangzhouensis TaxID=2497878 RepID=UPI0014385451|nr:metalloregulator ArsR/SmtB family transcription factor [Nocardioides guangzhouensis]